MGNLVQKVEHKIKIVSLMQKLMNLSGVVFFAYSFVSFFFWLLNCFEVDWLYLFNWLFVIPYKIVSMFYRPHGISADFTLAIIGALSFVLALGCRNLVTILYAKEEKLEDEMMQAKLYEKRMRDKRLAKRSYKIDPTNSGRGILANSKLLFLVNLNIKRANAKDDFEMLTFQEVDYWRQLVNSEMLKRISFFRSLQKGYYRKNLFMLFNEFECVDKFIYNMKPVLKAIYREYQNEGIDVIFSVVLSALNDNISLEKELDCMDTILSLNLNDEILTTARFKISYDNTSHSRYILHYKGEYNLSKNLTVTNNQPVYSFDEKEVNGMKQRGS